MSTANTPSTEHGSDQLRTITATLMSIEKKVDGLRSTVDQVHITLHGHEELGAMGLMSRVSILETKVTAMEKERDNAKAVARAAAWVAGIGGGGGIVTTVINLLKILQ